MATMESATEETRSLRKHPSAVTRMERESKKEGLYGDMELIPFAVEQKLTQQWKATKLQWKFI